MLHVFNTWVVANLFHPLFIYFLMGSMDGEWFDGNYLGFYFLGLMYSFLFSIPLLIMAWLIFYFVRRSQITVQAKFSAWAFFVTTMPLCTIITFLYAFSNSDAYMEDIQMILPSALAALTAVLIRYKQFFKLMAIEKNKDKFENQIS